MGEIPVSGGVRIGGVRRRGVGRLVLVVMAAVLVVTSVGTASAELRPVGDVRRLAPVPTPPGFPEGIAVLGQRVYVAGPATFGTAGGPPSAVLIYSSGDGRLLENIPTVGEDLSREHANSGLALDRQGRVYVLNTQLGVYRLTRDGTQQPYGSPLPDIPQCGVAPPPCSPTPFDAPPLSNDLAFDSKGNLYVTDSLQATIWRIPPGGGAPEIWFQDIRLASAIFGVNGIRVSPDRRRIFVTVTFDLNGQGFVYSLPLVDAPQPGDLQAFHQYTQGEGPDGLAFGHRGDLYVSLAAVPHSGISVLGPGGQEKLRLGNPQPGSGVPYDQPAGIAFDGRGSLLVTNHALESRNPARFAVLDVWVDDRGSPLVTP